MSLLSSGDLVSISALLLGSFWLGWCAGIGFLTFRKYIETST